MIRKIHVTLVAPFLIACSIQAVGSEWKMFGHAIGDNIQLTASIAQFAASEKPQVVSSIDQFRIIYEGLTGLDKNHLYISLLLENTGLTEISASFRTTPREAPLVVRHCRDLYFLNRAVTEDACYLADKGEYYFFATDTLEDGQTLIYKVAVRNKLETIKINMKVCKRGDLERERKLFKILGKKGAFLSFDDFILEELPRLREAAK